MKKVIALFLCLVLSLVFVGCAEKGKTEDKKESHSVDVEYYAKIGQIPEHKYALGDDAEKMIKEFDDIDQKNAEESEEDHTHSVYSLIEGDDHNILIYESAKYYYKSDSKVSAIVSLDDSYGFKVGDVSHQITKVLGECEEKKGDKETLFFLPMPESCTYIEYKFGDNTLIFAFEENLLCATVLLSDF